jgi:hypothetical protein
MHNHQYYAELSASAACALACSEHLSKEEARAWMEHLGNCAECRALMLDFSRVSFDLVSGKGMINAPPGMLTDAPQKTPESGRVRIALLRKVVTPLAVAVLCIVALFFYWRAHGRPARPFAKDQAAPLQTPPIRESAPIARSDEPAVDLVALKEKYRKGQLRIAELEKQEKEDQEQLRASGQEKNSLRSQMSDYEKTISELRSAAQKRENEIGELHGKLVDAEKNADASTSELRMSSLRLLQTEQQLKQERGRKALIDKLQALLAAPNLHFADIHDDLPSGRQRFGRVLCSKEQGILFYAYGLADRPQANANVWYHVWGESKGVTKKGVKSLGVLQKDETQIHGWVLSFAEPDVLNQIDSVFVTAERREVTKPTGERMLSANLGDSANHP